MNYCSYAVGVIFFIGGDDLQRIITELKDVLDVETLGLHLGIRLPALLKIKEDYHRLEKQKIQVLYHWLKRMEIIESKRSEEPTWTRLAEAIAELNPKLSEKIRRQYC